MFVSLIIYYESPSRQRCAWYFGTQCMGCSTKNACIISSSSHIITYHIIIIMNTISKTMRCTVDLWYGKFLLFIAKNGFIFYNPFIVGKKGYQHTLQQREIYHIPLHRPTIHTHLYCYTFLTIEKSVGCCSLLKCDVTD